MGTQNVTKDLEAISEGPESGKLLGKMAINGWYAMQNGDDLVDNEKVAKIVGDSLIKEKWLETPEMEEKCKVRAQKIQKDLEELMKFVEDTSKVSDIPEKPEEIEDDFWPANDKDWELPTNDDVEDIWT